MRALWRRLLLLLPAGLAIVGMWLVMRWCIGNTMAEYAPDQEAARQAVQLAPADPTSHHTLAALDDQSLLPEEMPEALRQYEQAVRLSPHDYRLWMDLGRAYEEAGDTQKSEQALRHATQLAPAYALPHWYLGNVLLRQGRPEEAFAELRRASDEDPTLRPQAFNMAWHVYNKNTDAVIAAIGRSAPARAQLIEYLIGQKKLDDTLRLWSSFSAGERREQHEAGEKLMAALFGAHRYHTVLDIYNDLALSETAKLSVGELLNGGFEDNIGPAGRSYFDWQVLPIAQAQISIDAGTSHTGTRSLRISFAAASPLEFHNVSQFVVVEPGARYRLQYYVRTEDLKSASTLITEVLDGAGPSSAVLAASAPLPAGTHDWQPETLNFTTPLQSDGITIRLSRAPCQAAACPIFGKVWYDDFDLQRTGSASDARGGSGAQSLRH